MASVNACPKTKAEVNIAAKRIGCRNATNGRSSYMCIPNKEKTTLVEFCYNDNIGIHEKGNCLEANLGGITEHNCLRFSYGCPDSDYFKDELYKYPACQHINTNSHCYVMDPLCQNKTPIVETKESGVVYACFTVCGIAFLIIGAILLYLYREQRSRKENQGKKEEDEDKQPLLKNIERNDDSESQHTVKDGKIKKENAQNTVKDENEKKENDQATDGKRVQDTAEKTQNTVKNGNEKEENDQATDRNIVQDTAEKTQNTVKNGNEKEESDQATDRNIIQDTAEKTQNTVKDGIKKEENDLSTDRNIVQDTEDKTQNTVKDGKDKKENASDQNRVQDTEKKVKDGKHKKEKGGGQMSDDKVKMKRRHPFDKVKRNSKTKK